MGFEISLLAVTFLICLTIAGRRLWLRRRGVRVSGVVVDHVPPRAAEPWFDKPVIAFTDAQGDRHTVTPDVDRFIPAEEQVALIYPPGTPHKAMPESDTSWPVITLLGAVALVVLALIIGLVTGALPSSSHTDASAVGPYLLVLGGLLVAAIGVRVFRRKLALHLRGIKTTGTVTRAYRHQGEPAGVVIDFFDTRNRRIQFSAKQTSYARDAGVRVVYPQDDPMAAELDTPVRNLAPSTFAVLVGLLLSTLGAALVTGLLQ